LTILSSGPQKKGMQYILLFCEIFFSYMQFSILMMFIKNGCDFCHVLLCKCGLSRHVVSVHLSRLWILSKQINISRKSFRQGVGKPFQFFCTKRHGNISMGTPNGVSNACRCVRHKSWFWTNSWLAIIECWSARSTIVTVDRAVYRTDGDASVNLCLS